MVKENKWTIYKESDNARIRKEMIENPNADPPVIMIAIVAVALYPSLKKHGTAK